LNQISAASDFLATQQRGPLSAVEDETGRFIATCAAWLNPAEFIQ
jgi:hypothetical protein